VIKKQANKNSWRIIYKRRAELHKMKKDWTSSPLYNERSRCGNDRW
jgi:hypothetical protein